MAQKIKFNIIQSLFQLFSFLADKTGGWAMFVKPKILLGSVILSSVTACNLMSQQTTCYEPIVEPEQTDTIKAESDSIDVLCYKTIIEEPVRKSPKTPKRETIEVVHPVDIFSLPESEIKAVEVDINHIYAFFEVEQKPEFPGGMEALYKFIGKNLRLPAIMCYEGGMPGRVTCEFIVEKTGKISNVKILKKSDPALDKEAIRVLESMPDWIPGKQNGVPVRVKYTIPINIKPQ